MKAAELDMFMVKATCHRIVDKRWQHPVSVDHTTYGMWVSEVKALEHLASAHLVSLMALPYILADKTAFKAYKNLKTLKVGVVL